MLSYTTMDSVSYIAIIVGSCAVIITASICFAFVLWIGARIYYDGTTVSSPRVYRSTKMVDQKDIMDEEETDIFDLGEDDEQEL